MYVVKIICTHFYAKTLMQDQHVVSVFIYIGPWFSHNVCSLFTLSSHGNNFILDDLESSTHDVLQIFPLRSYDCTVRACVQLF